MTGIRQLILDMDGVLWHGDTPVPGLNAFFQGAEREGIEYVLATNNGSRRAGDFSDKIGGFGVRVPPERIVTSAETTAAWLSRRLPPGSPVYALGEGGLRDALTANGFDLLPPEALENGARPAAVIAALYREATYRELALGSLAIRQGARFLGTNGDATFPREHGLYPGAGSLLAFLETASGRPPEIIGKPGPDIFHEALRRLSGPPACTAAVGDRLDTDILGGKNAGLRTVLLLSGVSTREDIESTGVRPDWVFDDLPGLGRALSSV